MRTKLMSSKWNASGFWNGQLHKSLVCQLCYVLATTTTHRQQHLRDLKEKKTWLVQRSSIWMIVKIWQTICILNCTTAKCHQLNSFVTHLNSYSHAVCYIAIFIRIYTTHKLKMVIVNFSCCWLFWHQFRQIQLHGAHTEMKGIEWSRTDGNKCLCRCLSIWKPSCDQEGRTLFKLCWTYTLWLLNEVKTTEKTDTKPIAQWPLKFDEENLTTLLAPQIY